MGAVPEFGYVHLILIYQENTSFCLQIPLDIIHSLCLKPCKYLIFLGWCVLGVGGFLSLKHDGDQIPTDGDAEGTYYYVIQGAISKSF
jgi:hypothetical protein